MEAVLFIALVCWLGAILDKMLADYRAPKH